MNFSDYQNLPASEKIVLATLEASKRLMGWTVHAGSVYKLEGITHAVIASLTDSGTAYTEVAFVGAVTASKYYLDRDAQILYIRTTGSDNPNGRFITATFKLFFSNLPITLPYDLDSGFEVYWEPLIASNSAFGVSIDTIHQTSEAIEGDGSLTLTNDQDFWPAYFDKLTFENKNVRIYAYHRSIDPTEARLMFDGKVEKRSYSTKSISFSLRDTLSVLKTPLSLGTIEDLALRTGDNLAQAKQRMLLGRVFGHVPVNVDQVLDGYPITGTVAITFNSATLTGTGTAFLTQLSPDDRLILDDVEYTVGSIASNTSLTLTENYAKAAGLSGATAYLLPEQPKRWINREWHIAGHVLRQPETTVTGGSSITRLFVDDGSDIYPGDWVYIGTLGSGELVQVESINSNGILNLATSLATIPAIGTAVMRPCVQNVRINDVSLVFYRDYTVDPDTATLTLLDTAESNAGPVRHLTTNLTFSNGSRSFTGTDLKSFLKPGYMVGIVGQSAMFEVLSIDNDTTGQLRTAASYAGTAIGRYKSLIFDPDVHTLNMDVLGRTEDGTSTGTLPKSAPSIVKMLLTDLGLESRINEDSFTEAEDAAYFHLGVAYPSEFNSSTEKTYRDMINDLNRSVFGSIVQNSDYDISYHVLQPSKPSTTTRFDESDILDLKFESTSEKLVKTAIVQYQPKEYDYLTGDSSISTESKTSDTSLYITGATETRTIVSKLVNEADARVFANRWAFILEHGAGRATIETKLRGMDLDVGSIIDVEHRKFFERLGMSSKRRLFLVESVKRSGMSVTLEVVDLSNAFSRVATINTLSATYGTATDEQKLYGGFITDQYGIIDDDPESFGLNLIW